MKYRGKEYKWFEVMFIDGKPEQVHLYKKTPFEYGNLDGKVTTYWENEKLTEKPEFTV